MDASPKSREPNLVPKVAHRQLEAFGRFQSIDYLTSIHAVYSLAVSDNIFVWSLSLSLPYLALLDTPRYETIKIRLGQSRCTQREGDYSVIA